MAAPTETLSPTKAKKAQLKRQRERLQREVRVTKALVGSERSRRRRAEAALRDLMSALEGYRRTQLEAESVNDGWGRVIAAYAVARDRLAVSDADHSARAA